MTTLATGLEVTTTLKYSRPVQLYPHLLWVCLLEELSYFNDFKIDVLQSVLF